MAFIDLGKLKFNWRGTWVSSATYEVDDVVFYNGSTYVLDTNQAAGQDDPQVNGAWNVMASGLRYRQAYNSATTYYLNDIVLYGSALYILQGITEDQSQTAVDPPNGNWAVYLPQAAADVLHNPGDMVYRNQLNANARLVVPATKDEFNPSLSLRKEPRETYSSLQFTYELNGTKGNTIVTATSVPAVSYSITTAAVRDDHYVLTGTDRNGEFDEIQDKGLTVNIGDTIVFDNTATNTDAPMAIRVANGGSSVSTGTYTGEGTATVTWVTTGVTAGTYYYQSTNSGQTNMVGTIEVVDPTNRKGSNTANGIIDCCRGQTYTITFDNVTDQVTYNIFNGTGAAQTGAGNALTSGEGNSGGVQYTTGNPVTITFTPNQTTPDIVHLTSQANSADNVTINVHDMTVAPVWDHDLVNTAMFSGRITSVNRGTTANAWYSRHINYEDYGQPWAALNADTVSFDVDPGTYYIRYDISTHDTGYTTSRLMDYTDSATPVELSKSRGMIRYNHPSYPSNVHNKAEGVWTFTQSTNLRVQHIVAVAASNGYTIVGSGAMQQDDAPVTWVYITKLD